MTVLLLFVVGCASSHPTVASTSTVRANTTISAGAATQTTSRGSAIADLLLSSCVLHRSRAQVRAELTKIVAADKVELFLQQYDAMAC